MTIRSDEPPNIVPTTQDEVFASSEGDNWFARNKQALNLFNPKTDLPLRLMELYKLQPRSVLEVGAANGFRLAEICKRNPSPARAVALDPSVDAISDGRARFPLVSFVRGEARAIPLQESFDLVIVNFILHWIDRTLLLRSVAEIDRVLTDHGYLIIGDFYPFNLTRVPYHHLEGEIYTYKQDYAAAFLASGLYDQVCMLTGSHSANSTEGESSDIERTGTWLLRKTTEGRYIARSIHSDT